MTKDVNANIDRNVLKQYRRLLVVYLKQTLNKHNFKVEYESPNHKRFRESFNDKMFNLTKFNKFLK